MRLPGADARLAQPRRAARRRGEPAGGIVPRDDRRRVDVQMVAVLVRDQNQVCPNLLGGDRRRRQSLEADEPLDGVGEIGVEIDDLAGGRFESEPRLPQPP